MTLTVVGSLIAAVRQCIPADWQPVSHYVYLPQDAPAVSVVPIDAIEPTSSPELQELRSAPLMALARSLVCAQPLPAIGVGVALHSPPYLLRARVHLDLFLVCCILKYREIPAYFMSGP